MSLRSIQVTIVTTDSDSDSDRIYADRTAVMCDGKCVKFLVSTIRADGVFSHGFLKIKRTGGVEASILRGCFSKLVDTAVHSEPADVR